MAEKAPKDNILSQINEEMDESVHPFLQKILDNIKLIGVVVGIVLLAVASYSLFTFYQQKTLADSRSDLGRVLTENQGDQLIDSLKKHVQTHSRTATKALFELARVQMEQGQYAEAAETWADLADQAGGDLKVIALLGQAKAHHQAGNHDQAMSLLESLSETAPDSFDVVITIQVSETAEMAGNLNKALAAYEYLRDAVEDKARKDFFQYKIDTLKEKLG